MALTEEEKKKQLKLNSQQPLSSEDLSLEDWYGSQSASLESNRQKQVENAYINQQLLNKYLGTKMANTGLANTGASNLYYTNANAQYRNEIGNINSAYQSNQQDLYNQYYSYKKAEEQEKKNELQNQQNTLLGMYENKVNNSLNEYGYLDDETINDLYNSFDMSGLGETNAALLEQYINSNRGTSEAIKNKQQNDAFNDLYYQIADSYNSGTSDYNAFNTELDNALANGSISKEQYYKLKEYNNTNNSNKQTQIQGENFDTLYYQISDAYNNRNLDYTTQSQNLLDLYRDGDLSQEQYYKLKEYLDTAQDNLNVYNYDKNAQDFDNKIIALYDSNNKLTQSEANQLYSELNKVRDDIGEENYNNAYNKILNSTETVLESELREIKKQYPKTDTSNYIDVNDATVQSFGDYIGVGSGGTQDNWVTSILRRAKRKGGFTNGDVIDFNAGFGTDNYMYYNGKFYKTTAKANIKA